MNRTAFDEVSFLWAEHQGLTFPDALRGVEIHGEPVAFLDASLAGNVSAYLAGRTDPWLLVGLDDCLQDLRDLLPALHGREGRDYVLRLTRMAELILSDPKTGPRMCERSGISSAVWTGEFSTS